MKLIKDNFNRKIIGRTRNIFTKYDCHFGRVKKWNILYSYINLTLKKDYKNTDNKFSYLNISFKNNKKTPYKFWVMWWQGIEDKNIPPLVRKNIIRLKKILGKDNVILITKNNYQNYTNIPNNLKVLLKENRITFTGWSDVVRFHLLRDNGGYWIDSTVLISPIFKTFIEEHETKPFFSLCTEQPNYRNISQSKWTIWLIGGKPHYSLFEYMCLFYQEYFANHGLMIDYYLTDAAIMHFYKTHSTFRDLTASYKRKWERYYLFQLFESKYSDDIKNKFNNNINYSVQKLTYKFDTKILQDKESVATYVIENLKGF